MKTKQYRYRDNYGATHISLIRTKHLPKVGRVQWVKGYRYVGRYGATHEAVMVKGDKGTCRFSGFCWSYGGTGPQGLIELLKKLRLPDAVAKRVAFTAPRKDECGTDWMITFHDNKWSLNMDPKGYGVGCLATQA